MAKDLPYFKFFCSEWNDGDITLESFEAQGVFINVCSYYWSRECNVTKKQLLKRFRNEVDIIKYLTDERFLKINNDILSISFLDEQYEEVESTAKSRSKAGKKSAKLKKLRKELNDLCIEYSEEFQEDLTSVQQTFNKHSTSVDFVLQQISTIKIRRDKIRKEKTLGSDGSTDLNSIETTTEDESVKSIAYDESDFLKNWNEVRSYYLGTPSNLNKLKQDESDLFYSSRVNFVKDDFHSALNGLFQQEKVPRDIMWFRPKHLLENIETYIDAQNNKRYKLYA